jgi:hypothetical protein
MSDGSIIPGDPGGQMSYDGFDDEGSRDNRRLLLLGGGAALLVVIVIAYLVLKGGGGSGSPSSEVNLIPRGTPHSALTPTPTASPGAKGGTGKGGTNGGTKSGTKLPKKTHIKLGRDPFKVLYNTAVGAGAGGVPVSSTTVSPGPGTTTGGTGTGTVTGTGTDTGTGTGTGTVGIPTSPAEGGTPTAGPVTHGNPIWIELVATHGVKEAVFNVGYQDHKFRRFTVTAPGPGSTTGTIFDNEFALLSIQGNEVTIQVGDDTPFDLRKGVSHQLV